MKQDTIEKISKVKEHCRNGYIRLISQTNLLGADQDGNRKKQIFSYAERPPGVRTIVMNDDYILLNQEWREEVGKWDYRIPGGKVYDEKDFDKYIAVRDNYNEIRKEAQKKAKLELLEESKLNLPESDFKLIHTSKCGSSIIWDLYYYKVEIHGDLPQLSEVFTDEGEHTKPEWILKKDLKQYCLNGKINEDRTIAVLFKYIIK